MLRVCGDLSRIFPRYADRMAEVCARISELPGARKIVLFGSYAKGTATYDSDVDLAVFFDEEDDCLIKQYRQLVSICADPEIDIQAQPFHTYELIQPCGIIEEVVACGIELDAR